MINQTNLSVKMASDSGDLNTVRVAARQNSPEALRAAAQQFEALFMNMVMKSMRQATSQEGLFDNDQSRMYTSMLDQQISQNFAKRGIGLADAMIRQLSNNGGNPPPGAAMPPPVPPVSTALPQPARHAPAMQLQPTAQPQLQVAPQPAAGAPKSPASHLAHMTAFQQRHAVHADEASRITGIPARFMLGQAALESGWGRREILHADGTPSHNLFGIKATGGWKGKVVETMTTEYVNGAVEKKVEKFRAYDSYAESFRDYAQMLSTNPRYRHVIANAQGASSFVEGLQRAGYATDPNYAEKLTRIIERSLPG
jgi:flagellar protein FlgJ